MAAPGTPEWKAELEARASAAKTWLVENITLAVVLPFSVARDLLPSGMDNEKLQPIIAEIMPGETVEAVERSGNCVYVHLKRS